MFFTKIFRQKKGQSDDNFSAEMQEWIFNCRLRADRDNVLIFNEHQTQSQNRTGRLTIIYWYDIQDK